MKLVTILLFACLFPAVASANVMTFINITGDSSFDNIVYIEDGITATGNRAIARHGIELAAHMDDQATPFPSIITFTMDTPFDAVKFDFNGSTRHRDCSGIEADLCMDQPYIPYNNMVVQGLRDGIVVAADNFWTGYEDTYAFDSAFTNLDELLFLNLSPSNPSFECMIDFCSHIDIDNITLSPVPLPASLPIFGAGILVILGFRRWILRKRFSKLN